MTDTVLFGPPLPHDTHSLLKASSSTSVDPVSGAFSGGSRIDSSLDYFGTNPAALKSIESFLSKNGGISPESGTALSSSLLNSNEMLSPVVSGTKSTLDTTGKMHFLSPSSAMFVSDIASTSGSETSRTATPSASLTAVSFLAVTGSNFSWPDFTTPAPQTWNTAEEVDNYIFHTIEERDPTSAESETYIPKLEALPATPTVINGVLVNYRDITPVMSEVAHLQITTDKLQGQFQTAMGDNASSDVISTGEDYLSKSVSFGTLRDAILNSDAEKNIITSLYVNLTNTSPNNTQIQNWRNYLANGASYTDMRYTISHGDEARNAITTTYVSIANYKPDEAQVQWWEDSLNNSSTFTDLRDTVGHGGEARNAIIGLYSTLANYTPSDVQISGWQDAFASGQENYTIAQNIIGHGGEARNAIIGLYSTLANYTPSDVQISGWQDAFASGQENYTIAQNIIGHGGEARNAIIGLYSTLANYTPSDAQISGWQDAFASGQENYTIAQNIIGHGGEARNAIIGLYSTLANYTPNDAQISGWQDAFASGQENYTIARNIIGHGDEARAAIIGLYSTLANYTPSDVQISGWQDAFASGQENYTIAQNIIGHGGEARAAIVGLYWALAHYSPNDTQIQWWQNAFANGNGSYDSAYSVISHGTEAAASLKNLYQFVTGVPINDADLKNDEDKLYNGATLDNVLAEIVSSSPSQQVIKDVYADWGQLPPDTAALQTAGTALYNLSYVWTTTIQNQTADQLAAEAAAYTPSVSVSFQDQINNIASSTNQAIGLEANLLVNTYLEMSSDPADAKAQLVAGGENALAASIDEGSVLTELKKIENENNDDCDPVKFRNNTTIVKNISNNDIKTANQTFGSVNGTPWNQSYKDQGIQWKSKNSGTTANQQGLPYEAWVQNQLNPSQDPNGVVWLQAEKSNWKAFDHWDKDKTTATSDKTINLSASSYRDNPYAVAARVEASVAKMIGYDTDGTRGSSVTFEQKDITSYVLNLGVPYITDPATMDDQTRAEWKALCRAYHDAMNDVSAANGKSLTFNINPVS